MVSAREALHDLLAAGQARRQHSMPQAAQQRCRLHSPPGRGKQLGCGCKAAAQVTDTTTATPPPPPLISPSRGSTPAAQQRAGGDAEGGTGQERERASSGGGRDGRVSSRGQAGQLGGSRPAQQLEASAPGHEPGSQKSTRRRPNWHCRSTSVSDGAHPVVGGARPQAVAVDLGSDDGLRQEGARGWRGCEARVGRLRSASRVRSSRQRRGGGWRPLAPRVAPCHPRHLTPGPPPGPPPPPPSALTTRLFAKLKAWKYALLRVGPKRKGRGGEVAQGTRRGTPSGGLSRPEPADGPPPRAAHQSPWMLRWPALIPRGQQHVGSCRVRASLTRRA